MRTFDARHLSAEAQGDLRCRVVRAIVRDSVKPAVAARLFSVARSSVYNWLADFYTGGDRALAPRPHGRPRESQLEGYQSATIVRLLTHRCPSQLHLPFALWTREAVQQLIAQRTGLRLSVWTVGRYLNHWGFTPQRPLRRAYEQDPAAVRRWLARDYPAIRECARREKAEIHWEDEMGVRSQDQRGRSYGRRGHTPTIPGTGQRFGCNMISTVTNRGQMSFMIFQESFRNSVLLRFLQRLVRQAKRKVFLIWDRHPVHQAAAVERWLRGHAAADRGVPTADLQPGVESR